MPKISSYTQSILIHGDDLIVARSGKNYKVTPEYGARIVWDAVDGYHVEPGGRGVNGEGLIWAANISRSSLVLIASTLYYVYLYNNSGTPAVEESTTVPVWNSTYRYWQKTGSADRRLVGTLYVNSSTEIQHFVTVLRGSALEYYYLSTSSQGTQSPPFEVITAGASTTFAAISIPMIPANAATHWYCAGKINFPADGNDAILGLAPIDLDIYSLLGGSAMFTIRTAIGGGTNKRLFTGRAWLPLQTSQTYYYAIQNITGSCTAYIECHGYSIDI